MTVMLPRMPNPGATGSEKVIFSLIENAPDSEQYCCLHSVGIARHERKPYAECDFVIIGPPGVFCLEVKGGQVSRVNGLWHIGWEDKSYISVEGPFKQAQSLKWPLKNEVDSQLSKDFTKDVVFGWGVAFPDIEFKEKDPEWDLDVVFDNLDKDHSFLDYIKRLARYFEQNEQKAGKRITTHLSPARVKKIVGCFRHDFDLVPGLRSLVADTDRELLSLSEDQYRVLDYALLPDNPRTLCPGAAGTGKTLVALEAAKRLGQQGHRVLFLCFNRILAEFLSSEISSFDRNISVHSLHKYMKQCIEQSGRKHFLPVATEDERSSEEIFRNIYPALFEEAILDLVENEEFIKYDILILDEGQDILHSPTIDAIGFVLQGGLKDGRWLIFYDPGLQSKIYGRMDDKVIDYLQKSRPVTWPLKDNYRNPPSIVKEMSKLIGIEPVICKRKVDSNVNYITYKDEKEQGKKLNALLIDLLKEGIKPGRVSILSACRMEKSCVQKFPPETGKKVELIGEKPVLYEKGDVFLASTISAFKGMENDIVILTDLPVPSGDEDWDRSVAYVGMTRAKTAIYALVSEGFLSYRVSLG